MVQAVEIPENTSTATGLTGSFAFSFTITHESQVFVEVTEVGEDAPTVKLQGYDFDVSGSFVVFRAGRYPPAGATVRRFRVTPLEQSAEFGSMARYRPEATESAFDRIYRALQDVALRAGLAGGGSGVPTIPVIVVPAVQDFAVSGVLREAPDGSGWPAAAISAEAVTASQILDLMVQYRVTPAGTWRTAVNLPAAVPFGDFTAVLGGETYDFRARWRAIDGGVGAFAYVYGVEIPEGGFVSYAAGEIGGLTPAELLAEIAAAAALGADAAAQVVALAAEVTDQGSAIVALDTATDTMATSLSGLTTTVNGHTSTIASLSTTTADMATQIDTLETGVGSASSAITTLQTVTNGLGALWTLSLNVNGKVSGMRSYNGGDISSIQFMADQIGFTDGTTTLYPLAIVGGIVRATNLEVDSIRANTIVTDHLTGGATSKMSLAISYTSVDLATEQTVHAFWFTCSGGKMLIDVMAFYTQFNASVVGMRGRIYRDGSLIFDTTWPSQGPFADSKAMFQYDDPGPGTYYYTVTMNTLSGITGVVSNSAAAIVTELKKAA